VVQQVAPQSAEQLGLVGQQQRTFGPPPHVATVWTAPPNTAPPPSGPMPPRNPYPLLRPPAASPAAGRVTDTGTRTDLPVVGAPVEHEGAHRAR
jgi:hypothetical protein